ncbi:helix-turn-helix transcriptional regulator [Streptomyces gramineus]|uniref:helix-turn-helix transcriptional regulator n=1 Tax=Streptomyces gramineus TaxID=910542 RepID=UPI00398ADC45
MLDPAAPPPDSAQEPVPNPRSLPAPRGPGGDEVERWLTSLCVDRVAGVPDMVRLAGQDADRSPEHPPRDTGHVLCFAESGRCHGTVGRERVVLGAGAVLWARPGVSARLRAPAGGTCLVHRLRLTSDPSVDVFTESFLLADAVWEARGLLAQLSHELSSRAKDSLRGERVRGLLTMLFTSVIRAADCDDAPGVLSRSAQQLITELADRRIHERLRAADLADTVGLTPDYFTRVFRRTFGMPPREWLMQRRVRHGAWMLDTTDASVTQVAQFLGYPDPFLFSRQFKLVMAVPPQTYRRRQGHDVRTPAPAVRPDHEFLGVAVEGADRVPRSPRASRP